MTFFLDGINENSEGVTQRKMPPLMCRGESISQDLLISSAEELIDKYYDFKVSSSFNNGACVVSDCISYCETLGGKFVKHWGESFFIVISSI